MRGFFLGTGLIVELIILLPLVGAAYFGVSMMRRARRFGYPSTRDYLRAAPRTDAEKRDAADLAIKTSQATPRLQLEMLVCELSS